MKDKCPGKTQELGLKAAGARPPRQDLGPKIAKAQISVEMLLIVGLAIAMLTPVLLSVFSRIADSERSLAVSQADVAAGKLASAIDSVAYSGSGSSMVVEAVMPQGVKKIGLKGHELVLSIETGGEESEIVKPLKHEASEVAIELENPGAYRILVEMQGHGGQQKAGISLD